jgi:hypothetical protein
MLVELMVMMVGCMEKMSQDAEAGSSSAGSQRVGWIRTHLALPFLYQGKGK